MHAQFVIARSAQRRGDLVAAATTVTPTRLPRCALNDKLRQVGTREALGRLEVDAPPGPAVYRYGLAGDGGR